MESLYTIDHGLSNATAEEIEKYNEHSYKEMRWGF